MNMAKFYSSYIRQCELETHGALKIVTDVNLCIVFVWWDGSLITYWGSCMNE